MNDTKTNRRGFLKLCGGSAALVAAAPGLLASTGNLRPYQRVQLVDVNQRPLRADGLVPGETYVFHYPYVATPCFLMDLGRPAPGGEQLRTRDGAHYTWPGGAGPQRSLVAFSAICAHRMSHPARTVSFINYRHSPTSFTDAEKRRRRQGGIIYCCSEKSVYDAGAGARVLGGPAPQPLASIELDFDAGSGDLFAVGTRGGEMFERFFDEFGFRLMLDYGTEDIVRPVTRLSTVVPLREFSGQQQLC